MNLWSQINAWCVGLMASFRTLYVFLLLHNLARYLVKFQLPLLSLLPIAALISVLSRKSKFSLFFLHLTLYFNFWELKLWH